MVDPFELGRVLCQPRVLVHGGLESRLQLAQTLLPTRKVREVALHDAVIGHNHGPRPRLDAVDPLDGAG